MKKLIFKIALLSTLLIFVACTEAGDNVSSGSSNLTIPNSTLVAKFFGDMASNDQNTEKRAIAGSAGINEGGVTFKFDKQTEKFVDGKAEIKFHNDDNTAAEQSAALKARVAFEASAIIQHKNNKINGLSQLVDVQMQLDEGSTTNATAIVTVKTSGESKFEDGDITKTFQIALTGDYFAEPIEIPNTDLDKLNNKQSAVVTATYGTAGIAAREITISVTDGVFLADVAANVTFHANDNDVIKRTVAMKNAVTKAVSDILKDSINAITGLNKNATVIIKNIQNGKATATVTIKANDGYIFENKRYNKTFDITLNSEDIGLITITNQTLTNTFNSSADDKSNAITVASGTAGIPANGITLTSQNGNFNAITTNVTFNSTDSSAGKQNEAILFSVRKAVNEILKNQGNIITGLNPNALVLVTITDGTDTATATATINTVDGYQFEDKTTTKEIKVTLNGNFTNHLTISNSSLEVAFDGSDVSRQITGGIAINKGAITLKVTNGVFQDDHEIALTLSDAHTFEQQAEAIVVAVKDIVDTMLNDPLNHIEGLGESIVTNVVKTEFKKVTATVTINATGDYKFEDGKKSKTFNITLISDQFALIIIDETGINIARSNNSHKKAGLAAFTIPAGFANLLTPKVVISFHNLDNVIEERRPALKKAMQAMNIPKGAGVVVRTVSDLQMNGLTIDVTFSPATGYKFGNGDADKKVTIHVTGFNGGPGIQTIYPGAFKISAFDPASNYAGIKDFTVGANFSASTLGISGYNAVSGNPSDEIKQEQINKTLRKIFLQANSQYTEGMIFKDNSGNVTLDDWSSRGATYTITFDVEDLNGPFQYANKNNKLRITVIHLI